MNIRQMFKTTQRFMKQSAVALAAAACFQTAVHAAPVTVSNPSFETGNYTSWSGATGQWGVNSGTIGNFGPTDGTWASFANGPAIISQTLTDTLQPNTTYTLRVDVGHRPTFTQKAYTIALWAGVVSIASVSGAQNSIIDGSWTTVTAPYTSPGAVTAGQALTIKITGDGQQTWFDNVRLDATAITDPPPAPTNLGATAGNGQVALTWTASSGATGYNVKRLTGDGGSVAATFTTSGTSYTETGLINGQAYYYVVSATNAIGEGADSTQVSATPILLPPTNLAATAGDLRVALTWTASSGATGYNVKRLTGNGGSVAATFTTAGTSYTETGLINGQTYYYVVSATNAMGEGANSTQVSATPILLPPTNLAKTAGDSQVALTWTASSWATGYNVKRSTTSGSGYTTIGTPSGTSYTDSSAVNGTTYYYVVSATSASGESANSTQVSATPTLPQPPAAPTGLTPTPGNAQVVLTWTASSGATGYKVKRSTTSGSGYVQIGTPSGTSYTDSTAVNGTTYYYVVSATNSGGESAANSSEVSATPSSTVINVGDPSFEIGGASQRALSLDTPIVSPWGQSGSWGYCYTPSGAPIGGLYATQGKFYAYGHSSSISQTLTDTLKPNTTYTLSVDIGRRTDLSMPGYSISLYAGSDSLASASGGSDSFSPGWITATATYTSPSSVTAGQALKIVIGSSGVQVGFDNVRLSAVPLPPTGTLIMIF